MSQQNKKKNYVLPEKVKLDKPMFYDLIKPCPLLNEERAPREATETCSDYLDLKEKLFFMGNNSMPVKELVRFPYEEMKLFWQRNIFYVWLMICVPALFVGWFIIDLIF